MAKLPPSFLETILPAAKEHGLEAHVSADNTGLFLCAKEVEISEQCLLLKKLAADLHAAQLPKEPAPQQPENGQNPGCQSPIDCQVTVEERAQLFKFLTG